MAARRSRFAAGWLLVALGCIADPAPDDRSAVGADQPVDQLAGGSALFVRGRVLAGGVPEADAYVYNMARGVGVSAQQRTLADGSYEIWIPAPGKYEISVAPRHGRRTDWGEVIVDVGPGGPVKRDIELGGCSVAGTITDRETGRAVEGLEVRVYDSVRYAGGFRDQYAVLPDTTDAQGQFEIRPLRPGSYRLSFTGSTYEEQVSEVFALGADERRGVSLQTSSTRGEIQVRLDSWSGPRVEAVGRDGGTRALTHLENGCARLGSLRPGVYRVSVVGMFMEDGVPEERTIASIQLRLAAGESRSVELVEGQHCDELVEN